MNCIYCHNEIKYNVGFSYNHWFCPECEIRHNVDVVYYSTAPGWVSGVFLGFETNSLKCCVGILSWLNGVFSAKLHAVSLPNFTSVYKPGIDKFYWKTASQYGTHYRSIVNTSYFYRDRGTTFIPKDYLWSPENVKDKISKLLVFL